MTERQLKALNSLYAATIEVMDAFAPETVEADKRREALSRMLENFLISASAPGVSFVESVPETLPRVASPSGSIKEVSDKFEQVPVNSVSSAVISETLEKRYAVMPYKNDDGDYEFKRIKAEEDRDEDVNYLYCLEVGETDGLFAIQDCDLVSFKQLDQSRIPAEVVMIVSGASENGGSSRVVVVEKGRVEKSGKRWKVVSPVKIAYK